MCYGEHSIYDYNFSRFSRMSIPPLVCSTPPPPDQCEDDRDTDFDIQYNLSQDDEDGNDYNFGTYSDYIYPSTTSTNIQECKWSPDISKNTEGKLEDDLFSENENQDGTGIVPESHGSDVNKFKLEDIVIEDLNLTVESQGDVSSSQQSINKSNVEGSNIDCNSKDIETAMESITVHTTNDDKFNDKDDAGNDMCKGVTEDSESKAVSDDEKPYYEELPNIEDTVVMEQKLEAHKNTEESEIITDQIHLEEVSDIIAVGVDKIVSDETENKLESVQDSEFDDFDGFQFISSENNPTATIEYCDNPWDSEVSKNNDFGDFRANFDNNEDSLDIPSNYFDKNKPATNTEDIDDFGDFDDFQSSSNEQKVEILNENIPSQHVQVLSLSSPDSEVQVIGSINNVLNSIFTSEITDTENDFESKLESLLNETWGHLVDTDVRQPYMVNWNNSLGQKSLLKALCIDSRNILFGPKWNNGMPKYAANLSVAPLQPQKPFISTNTTNTENQSNEKASIKEPSTWTDPFTSNGQESCNTENGTSAAVPQPANLDKFANTASPGDKIYSTTLSVQPIRQINLPDTHIFTPTDSETPRSKTIHYDNGPTVLVPQPLEKNTTPNESVLQKISDVSGSSVSNDDDYWEFQDFQGTANSNKNVINSETQVIEKCKEKPSTNITQPPNTVKYQTQILQPIKVEPIMPTLNWPDPGHVKETFEDFTDFISNTTWNNENINTDNQTNNQLTQVSKNIEVDSVPKTKHLDDEFETFQSAPLSKANQESSKESFCANLPQHITDNNDISDIMHSKPDNTVRFNEFQQSQQYLQSSNDFPGLSERSLPTNNLPNSFSSLKETNVKSSPVLSSRSQINNATILQPSIASTSGTQRSQQKTGQILQPLSLESYSQINWPNPGIDLQDLSRFNPVESLQSLKSDVSVGAQSKLASPAHKEANAVRNEISDEDIWGDFVSSKPKHQQPQTLPKKSPGFADDDEWTDFVSSPSVKPQNGLNTISLNVHTNLNLHKSTGQNKFPPKGNQISLDIPSLNYITPKSSNRGLYNDKHFQNL